jgi:hypothetical protein
MMISYIIQDCVLEETGFGIYAMQGPDYEMFDFTVVVDFVNNTIYELGSDVHVRWNAFINAYNPKVLVEASATEGSHSA